MQQKTCIECNVLKDISEFHKHKLCTKDGHVNKCKECTKKYARNKYRENMKNQEYIEKERERSNNKYYRLNYKNKKVDEHTKKKYRNNFNVKYPEKYDAYNSSRYINKINGYENHHWSYNEEHYKDIIQISTQSHYLAHRNMVYDQERKMYRDAKTNELIDTRDSAIKFYKMLGCELFE